MIARYGPSLFLGGAAVTLGALWLGVSALGWVDSLTVLTGDGDADDVMVAALTLGAWFGLVLAAPIFALAAALDLASPALWTWLRHLGTPKGRRRNQ